MKSLGRLAIAGALGACLSVQAVAGTIIDCKEVKTGESASFYIADDGWQITYEVQEGTSFVGSMFKIVERGASGIRAEYFGNKGNSKDRELLFTPEGDFIVSAKGESKRESLHYQECDVAGTY